MGVGQGDEALDRVWADRQARSTAPSKALARRDHSAASLKAKLAARRRARRRRRRRRSTRSSAPATSTTRASRATAPSHLAAKGYGDEWIRGDLETQGVVADGAIAGARPRAERAEREAARLGGGVKALRTLARRGFSEESLEPLLHSTAGEE